MNKRQRKKQHKQQQERQLDDIADALRELWTAIKKALEAAAAKIREWVDVVKGRLETAAEERPADLRDYLLGLERGLLPYERQLLEKCERNLERGGIT